MKTCLCCGVSCAPDALSCPACGEASWEVHPLAEKFKERALADVVNLHAVASSLSVVIDDNASDEPAPASPDLSPLVDAAKEGASEIHALAETIEALGLKPEPEIPETESAPKTPDNTGSPIVLDPPTVVDVPRGRRSSRRS